MQQHTDLKQPAVPRAMHAAFIDAPGTPGKIRYGLLPVPIPGHGELLLRTEALAVNHVDLLVRSGAYPTRMEFPFIVGRDVVGILAGCRPGTEGFNLGHRFWCNSLGHAGRQESFSDYVLVPAESAHALPAGVAPT